jgi:hypothetical protein
MIAMTRESKGAKANRLRRAKVAAKQLREGAEELRRMAAALDAAADAMVAARIPAIEVDAATRLGRGAELIDSFVKHVRKAMIDAAEA